MGPRVIQIGEKFGLLKYVLSNVEASKSTYEYHYEWCSDLRGFGLKEFGLARVYCIVMRDGRPPSEQKKHDYLEYRFVLAEELIGSFSSRANRLGWPRSVDSQESLRKDSSKSYLPIIDRPKCECEVCKKVREVRGLKEKGARHESQIRCSVCDVHLCCNK